MTEEQFIAKWEEKLRESEALYKFAEERGIREGMAEEGQRMRAISEMLDDYKYLEK
jgi:hypothetical protein